MNFIAMNIFCNTASFTTSQHHLQFTVTVNRNVCLTGGSVLVKQGAGKSSRLQLIGMITIPTNPNKLNASYLSS